MPGTSDLLNHMSNELTAIAQVTNVSIKHLEDRSFSSIYEVTALHNGVPNVYILKISTTGRSCKQEFEIYTYLSEKGIKSLSPVLFSEKFNYLLTIREELVPFDVFVKMQRGSKCKKKCFYLLGEFFKDMEKKTCVDSVFDKDVFEAYLLPRIESLRVFSMTEKKECIRVFEDATTQLAGSTVRTCLVSDFSLGNINFNTSNEITVLDMGDAAFANRYENLSFIKLATRFGPLNQYFIIGNSARNNFNEFLNGYDFTDLESKQMNLYQFKHLVNMMLFISIEQSKSPNTARRILSAASNRYLLYRYKRYALSVIRALAD